MYRVSQLSGDYFYELFSRPVAGFVAALLPTQIIAASNFYGNKS